MFRMTTTCFAMLVVLSLFSARSLAADDTHDHDATRIGDAYPLLVDPLGDSLVDIDKPIVVIHEGRELRFASEENLKKFRAEPDKYLAHADARIIEQQKPLYPLTTCVVSGEKFGEMGDPVDIVYGNRLVRFCCKGCVGKFKKEPAKYLAKIDTAVIKAQMANYPMTTCVVSGEKLGGEMGDPIDYVIGNRLVRFCCKSCPKMFEKNPAKHLAMLDAHIKHGNGNHPGDGHHADDAAGHDQHGHNH